MCFALQELLSRGNELNKSIKLYRFFFFFSKNIRRNKQFRYEKGNQRVLKSQRVDYNLIRRKYFSTNCCYFNKGAQNIRMFVYIIVNKCYSSLQHFHSRISRAYYRVNEDTRTPLGSHIFSDDRVQSDCSIYQRATVDFLAESTPYRDRKHRHEYIESDVTHRIG